MQAILSLSVALMAGLLMSRLAKLAKLEGDYAVLPGHGEYSSLDVEKKYNPYMQDVL